MIRRPGRQHRSTVRVQAAQARTPESEGHGHNQNTDPGPSPSSTAPHVDNPRTLTPAEEDEIIEVVAFGYGNTTEYASRLRARFITCRAFRNKVLRADETYRRRRTLVDFAHSNRLRGCLGNLPDTPELRNVLPTDDLLNAYNYLLHTPPRITEQTTEAEMDAIYALLMRIAALDIFTNQNGQSTRDQRAIEITNTSRGAFLAAILRDQRVTVLNQLDQSAVPPEADWRRELLSIASLESEFEALLRPALGVLPSLGGTNLQRPRRR